MSAPQKASKKYLKELEVQKKALEEQLLNQPTRPRLATAEEREAGKATGTYGIIEEPTTEADRERYRQHIARIEAEIERVKKELAGE